MMYTRVDGLTDLCRSSLPPPINRRAIPEPVSAAVGIAAYFLGVAVETLGIGLVLAFGWIIVGGPIVFCGLALGMIGNRIWPAPEKTVSSLALVRGSFHRSLSGRSATGAGLPPRPRLTVTGRKQRAT